MIKRIILFLSIIYLPEIAGSGGYKIMNVIPPPVVSGGGGGGDPIADDADLTHDWKCQEGTGNTLIDTKGGKDITLYNSPAWVTGGIHFESSIGSYGRTDSNVNLTYDNTVYIKVKFSSTGYQNLYWFDFEQGTSFTGFLPYYNTYDSGPDTFHGGIPWLSSAYSGVAKETWHNLVITMDAPTSTFSIYMDGADPATFVHSNWWGVGGLNNLWLFIGAFTSGYSQNTTIGRISMFSRDKTKAEIIALGMGTP